MKIQVLLLSISLMSTGCSLSHKSVKSIGNNIFEISASNLAFSSLEDLKTDIRQKAQETCKQKRVEYLTNVLKGDIDSDLPLIVKIRCIA